MSGLSDNGGGDRGQPDQPSLMYSWKSAAITSLGLCLLLRGNSPLTMLLAGTIAIASKFCLRWRGKHIFNPTNFGLMGAVLLTNDAWVSPGQWGGTWWLLAIFIAAGGIVLGWVGRWETSVAFLATYGALEFLRDYWLGWSPDVWAHRLA
ncbi:MAG: Na+-transporting NADH:ubiquinone oxidoreductase, subunit NqrB, partial [Cyanobacteria bacterium J06641_5]